jgi:cobalt-zinc-cadmium efflux system outer membrane protein
MIAVALALMGSLAVQPPTSPSDLPPAPLNEAAVAASPVIEAASADLEAALARAEQLRLGGYEVTVTGAAARRTVDGVGDFTDYSGGVSRSFRWPEKRRADMALADVELRLARADFEIAWRNEALRLTALWNEWRLASELARLAEADARDAADAAAAESRLTARGAAREVDVDQLRADAALAELAMLQASESANRARSALAAAFPQLLLPEAPPPFADAETLRANLAAQMNAAPDHPEHRAARLGLERIQLVERRARLSQRPDPELGLEVFSEFDGDESGVGVTLAVPLSGRGRAVAADESRSASLAQEARRRGAAREVVHVYAAALDAVELAASRLSAAELAASASGTALRRVSRGRDLGASTVSELITARRMARQAEQALLEERAAATLAAHRLAIFEGRLLEPPLER